MQKAGHISHHLSQIVIRHAELSNALIRSCIAGDLGKTLNLLAAAIQEDHW